MESTDTWTKVVRFGRSNPIQFVASSVFAVTAAIPLAAFLAYAIGTLIGSVIGMLVLEVFLLFGGLLVLGLVLFVVVSITACITAIFASLYYAYKATLYAVDNGGKRVRSQYQGNPEVDAKLKSLPGNFSQSDFESSNGLFWTAAVTLFLIISIAVMCVMVFLLSFFVITLS